jgi:hypothetical protein
VSVYFATCREAGAVKIGSSVDPFGRLPEIQIGCPLLITIEAILPGGCEEEFRYHKWFEDVRIRGEWFTITDMIEEIIKANPAPKAPANYKPRQNAKPRERAPKKMSKAGRNMTLGYNDRLDRKRYAQAMDEMRAEAAKLEGAA